MSTSKFEKRFYNNTGNPLLGATIEIVPQQNTYPTGKIALIEHPTRRGWYYKDGVPINEYKVYINGSLYTQNIFHAEMVLYHITALFDSNLKYIGETGPDILVGNAGEERELNSIITAGESGIIDFNNGAMQLPDVSYGGDVTTLKNAIQADNTGLNELSESKYRLQVRFYDPGLMTLVTKTFIAEDEIKDFIDCGTAAFTGTQQTCIVPVEGGSVNDRYFLQPNISIWNTNDLLMVSAQAGQFLVTRGPAGTSGLNFTWFRRKYGTF